MRATWNERWMYDWISLSEEKGESGARRAMTLMVSFWANCESFSLRSCFLIGLLLSP